MVRYSQLVKLDDYHYLRIDPDSPYADGSVPIGMEVVDSAVEKPVGCPTKEEQWYVNVRNL